MPRSLQDASFLRSNHTWRGLIVGMIGRVGLVGSQRNGGYEVMVERVSEVMRSIQGQYAL